MFHSYLHGERVRLTAIERDDLPTIARWHTDETFGRFYNGTPAVPRSAQRWAAWLEEIEGESNAFYFAVRHTQTTQLLGIADISGILWNNRNGALGLGIGAVEHRRQGYGGDAMRLLLRFAFEELNLHRVWLTVFSYNHGAIQMYEGLGFTHEGTHREHILRGGQAHDMHLYGLLQREWAASHTGNDMQR